MKPYLSIKSIWEDESLFEVRVTASNGSFSGAADCYTNRDEIIKLAESVEGFPKRIGQVVTFTTSEREDLSFFTLQFKCVDGSGHIVMRVKVAHIVSYSNAEQEKCISEFDIKVEASSIDTFVKSVKSLAMEGLGEVRAILHGNTIGISGHTPKFAE